MSAKNAPAILPNLGQFVVFVQPVHYRVWGMSVGSAPKCWTIHYEARSGWLQLLSSRRLWPCLTTCGASCLEEILIETLPWLSTHYQPRANYQHNINHNQLSTHNQYDGNSVQAILCWKKILQSTDVWKNDLILDSWTVSVEQKYWNQFLSLPAVPLALPWQEETVMDRNGR